MSEPVALSIQHVSKAFRIWQAPSARLLSPLQESAAAIFPRHSRLKSWLRGRAQRHYRDFYALHDVSLTVRKGESIGIVGRNGSGKSTLLQIVAGTSQPTVGKAETHGRVAALLELGSGFNPEFTGRENVHLNGTVLGLSRAEIDARYDDIVAFSEIGEFIDQPVKTYSSGMVVRLAFAVAAHVDPDILIIDEALSVGDARFQLKCARAIDRFVERGVTLLFVSHSMDMVKRLCSRAILLEHGKVIYTGKPNDVVNLYSKLTAEGGSVEALEADLRNLETRSCTDADESLKSAKSPSESTPSTDSKERQLLVDERAHVQVSGSEYSYGGELGRIEQPTIKGSNGEAREWFTSGEEVTVSFLAQAQEKLTAPIYALTIKNHVGQEVYGTNTFYRRQETPGIESGQRHRVTFRFPVNLIPGSYFISLGWTQFVGDTLLVIHRRYDVIKFDVHGVDQSFGIANLWAQIAVDTHL